MKILIFSILVYNTLCLPDHDYEIIGNKEFRQWKREHRKASEAELDKQEKKKEHQHKAERSSRRGPDSEERPRHSDNEVRSTYQRSTKMQLDVFDEFADLIEEKTEADESLGSLLKQVIGESRTVRRRLNRAIQENNELRKRLNKIEFLVGGEAPAEENEIISGFTSRLEKLETDQANDVVQMTELTKKSVNAEALITASTAKTNKNTDDIQKCKKDVKKLLHQTEKFKILNDDSELLDDLNDFHEYMANADQEKEELIDEITERIGGDDLGFGIDMRSMPEQSGMSSGQIANMAKAMWNLPTSCHELADKGLTTAENGPYLIRPSKTSDPFMVDCDFGLGVTVLKLKNKHSEFPACEGSECSVIDFVYELDQTQLDAFKSEMRHCHQSLNFTCSSTSVSDRVSWMGADNNWNRYYSGKGDLDGCGCSMDDENNCAGGFLCNCDAISGVDSGVITSKNTLPIQSLHASDINQGGLQVDVGDLICSGRPGWSNWGAWSLCDKSCDTGIQIRTRICEGDQERCPGESFQDQLCNEHVCPEWSDWSNWSHCIDRESKQKRACGEKERFRMCSEENGCPGDAIEYDQCDCVLVLGGNGHKLNASLIDYESQIETQVDLGSKIPMPALTAHCMVNFNDRVFVIGGWNTRDTVFELRECGLIPLRFRLPRDYRVHSCAVHDNKVWVCGSRDSPYACDSYDENWVHQAEMNTIYAHSYGSLVSDRNRGLSIIGGVAPMLGRNDKVEFFKEGKWSQGPSLPNVLSSHTSHMIDDDIYVFGGLIADSGRLGQVDTIYKLAAGADAWKSVSRLHSPRSHHASVALPNGGVFVFGDPYVRSEAEVFRNGTSTELTVSHAARAFPAAVHVKQPVC